MEWFKKSAGQGVTGAQYHLGYCFYHGLGVEQDYSKAFYWSEQAIKKNHATAEYYIGL